jgi:glycosyltransferase involved in cell wall biosynthesis
MSFVNLIVLLGVVGLLGSTIGNSVLAWIISRLSLHNLDTDSGAPRAVSQALKIEVLVPCHNGQAFIQKTLESVADAHLYFRSQGHDLTISVGLDHCTDQTANQIQHFIYNESMDVRMTGNPHEPGKWNMLKELVRQSTADWVALVDVGSVWDQKLLMEALPSFQDRKIMCVAPSYGAVNAGLLERINWAVERILKSIESSAGGPISVHGATVFYKRDYLVKALAELEGTAWLNDDVVIPLTLRTLFPRLRIVYLASHTAGKAWVTDFGVHDGIKIDLGRRKRMLIGNLQWIRSLFGKALRSDSSVGLIAARRVFRTFWAYAILCLMIGAAIHALSTLASGQSTSLFALSVAFALFSAGIYRMRAAFWAGLQIPFQLYKLGSTSSENLWN